MHCTSKLIKVLNPLMKRQCTHCTKSQVKSKFKPVTHVIFDLDGVIIDSENMYREAFKKTIKDYGFELTHGFYLQVCGNPAIELAKNTIEHYNLDVSVDNFIKKYRGYSRVGMTNLALLPGVERTINHFHNSGVPISIATSSVKESFIIKTAKFKKLMDLFHHIVFGCDVEVKQGKPEPDIFLVAASRFVDNPDPSKCLVFEDSFNGMKAALAAGMQIVLIPNEMVPKECWNMATLKIDSFNDLVPELFGLPPFPDN